MSSATTTVPNELPAGYPRLAERMGLQPELAIFRRFAFLNKLNILCLQAELSDIEEELKHQYWAASSPSTENLAATDWCTAIKNDPDIRTSMVIEAREKLEKYSTSALHTELVGVTLTIGAPVDAAIIQQSKILAMDPPKKMDLDYVQKFISDANMMGQEHPFSGVDANVWGSIHGPNDHAKDIITPYPYHQKDMFSKMVKKRFFAYGLDKLWRSCKIGDLEFWDDKVVDRLTFMVSTALASILPVVSIIILYYVESMEARFGVMVVFNILISICLGLFTHARRSEIFAVTAAFSAIQVVFVQVGDPNQATAAG
ncbi:hypothetical protein HDK90DRAFT_461111 [Phyllosticta capitalensis]|uniref:DUF6594 domain-containing protein n=1 Tax=Phyllosticta capitalensis TaxID=121624 RepID=A0ABR1Z1H4_9PEZI